MTSHRTQYTPKSPPGNLEAVLREFRAECKKNPRISCAAAQKIVMRITPYEDHMDLAQNAVNYLRNRKVLVAHSDGGYLFQDPESGTTPARRDLPSVEEVRRYLELQRGNRRVLRQPMVKFVDALANYFQITTSAAVDLANLLLEQNVVSGDDHPAYVCYGLKEAAVVSNANIEEQEAPGVTLATPTSPAAAVDTAPEPGTKTPKRVFRITPAELRIVDELRKMDEVEGLYTFIGERIGGSKSNVESTFHAFIRTGRFLVKLGASSYRVDHAAMDAIEFKVDDALRRAKTLPVAKHPVKTSPVPKRSEPEAEDDVIAVFRKLEKELDGLKRDDAKDSADFDLLGMRSVKLRDELKTLDDKMKAINARRRERQTRIETLVAGLKKARKALAEVVDLAKKA